MGVFPDRNRMRLVKKRKHMLLPERSEYSQGGVKRMYAIIATGGKQYKVEEGQTLDVELLHAEAGETVDIDAVLMLNKDGEVVTGKPYVEGAKVTLKVVENGKAPKITVFKYKPKKNYRRKKGHRQPYTRVTVESIVG